jgi:D-alanine-D-alanine ligase-like ATP-grasp enzyme
MRRAAQVLRSPAIGFDVVLEDIAKPVDEQEFGIIESNSVPYLDVHHFPYVGKKHIATKALFDAVAELQGDSR